MKQIADTASPRFHASPAFAFMDFSPLSASPPLKDSTNLRNAEARGNLKPVLAFVKKVRTDLRGIEEHRKELNWSGALPKTTPLCKTTMVSGREFCAGIEGALVYREVLWLNLEALVRNARILQSLFLLLDI